MFYIIIQLAMKRILLFLPLIVLLSGCMKTTTMPPVGTGNNTGETTTGTIQTGTTTPTSTGQETLPDTTGTYTVNLWDEIPELKLLLHSGDKITLQVDQPITHKTVVRVNQIVTPDGTADGPFDSYTTHVATQSGLYTFRIWPSLMASQEPYTGPVAVHVLIEKK